MGVRTPMALGPLVALVVAGCRASPSVAPVIAPTATLLPDLAPRERSARERVDAAIASGEGPEWPVITVTSAYLAGPSAYIPPVVSGGIDADPVAGRPLMMPLWHELESPVVAWRALPCAINEDLPAAASFEAVTARPARKRSSSTDRSPFAECLFRAVLAAPTANGIDVSFSFDVRVTARVRLLGGERRGRPLAVRRPSIVEEIQALERGPADGEHELLRATREADLAFADIGDPESFGRALGRATERLTALVADPSVGRDALYRLGLLQVYTLDSVAALRAFACPASFTFPSSARALPQDHDAAYWEAWEMSDPRGAGKSRAEETRYLSPYARCTERRAPPRASLAEAWLALGAWHEARDRVAGPYRLSRASDAYARAVAAAESEQLETTLWWSRLSLSRALLEAGRPHAALTASLPLLGRKTFPELTERAAEIAAAALGTLDFEGAAEGDPALPRPDVFDLEPNPEKADQRLRVVVDRLEDGALVPETLAELPRVTARVAADLAGGGAYGTAIAVAERFLLRWPLQREAPNVRVLVADAYARIAAAHRGRAAKDAMERSRAARARLVDYGPGSDWAEANVGDSEALATGSALARGLDGVGVGDSGSK